MFSPDQCVFLMHFFTGSQAQEMTTTRKVIAAVPEDKMGFQLDDKGMSAGKLAWHIVTSEEWFLQGVLDGKFAMEDNSMPEGTTIADIVARYDKNVPALLEKVKAAPVEVLTAEVDFFGIMKHPAAFYLSFLNNHSIHHRGQLAAMLRPAGSKVPSIYGGSADEPFQG